MEATHCIGKLFDNIPVKFPIEQDLVIVHGGNGCGKTLTMNLLYEYFSKQNKNNTLYFTDARKLTVNCETILSVHTALKIAGQNTLFDNLSIFQNENNMMNFVRQCYNKPIYNGHLNILNFVCNIVLGPDEQIVLIDEIENSLDIIMQKNIIDELLKLNKIKKLFCTTHSPSVISNKWNNTIDIEECVRLYSSKEGVK